MDKREMVAEVNEDAILFDDLDEAIIGMVERAGIVSVAIYDYEKCVRIFMEKDGMSREDAIEWMEFNVVGAYVGEHTPMFLHAFEEEIEEEEKQFAVLMPCGKEISQNKFLEMMAKKKAKHKCPHFEPKPEVKTSKRGIPLKDIDIAVANAINFGMQLPKEMENIECFDGETGNQTTWGEMIMRITRCVGNREVDLCKPTDANAENKK